MLNVLKKTLQIDYAYSVNSFIYILQRLPILNDLLTKGETKKYSLVSKAGKKFYAGLKLDKDNKKTELYF